MGLGSSSVAVPTMLFWTFKFRLCPLIFFYQRDFDSNIFQPAFPRNCPPIQNFYQVFLPVPLAMNTALICVTIARWIYILLKRAIFDPFVRLILFERYLISPGINRFVSRFARQSSGIIVFGKFRLFLLNVYLIATNLSCLNVQFLFLSYKRKYGCK